ncbi:Pr6Pr family membrane protein [Streptomyces sp. NPDC008150]|uniref:Pr6Pr family membrane protein n=1 Tax=Streptomyces sp. NPDC008150 TaxID=3364816 RepID=UPI0036E0891F
MTAPIPREIPDLPPVPGVPVLMPSHVPASAVMAPAHRPLVATYRLLIALAAAAAIAVEVALGSPTRVLSHFAVQSNILLAVVLALSARRAFSARRALPAGVTGAALLYVAIGGFVFHMLLADASTPYTMTSDADLHTVWQSVAEQVLCTATPIAAALDWLLLTTPGRMRLRQASTWLLYPMAYLAFSFTRGELIDPGTPGRYLYPFLDVDLHGYKSVLANSLLLGLAFYALAVLLVAVDHTRPGPLRGRGKTGFRL